MKKNLLNKVLFLGFISLFALLSSSCSLGTAIEADNLQGRWISNGTYTNNNFWDTSNYKYAYEFRPNGNINAFTSNTDKFSGSYRIFLVQQTCYNSWWSSSCSSGTREVESGDFTAYIGENRISLRNSNFRFGWEFGSKSRNIGYSGLTSDSVNFNDPVLSSSYSYKKDNSF